MSEPINFKLKKIISQTVHEGFDKALVLEALEKNLLLHWDTWGRFQQVWVNSAFKTFRDFEKYLVLIFLISDQWQKTSDKFKYYSLEEFYSKDQVAIDKINLIKISNELDIPKETIRRKVNELQKEGVLSRQGKKIIITKSAFNYQKPIKALEALSIFLEKKARNLKGEDWFGDAMSKEEIKAYIEKYFTIIWLRFLKLQIPFLLRHRSIFGDLETWMIWGNVAVNHQKHLAKITDSSVIFGKPIDAINYDNYYDSVANVKIKIGVNASSISDITSIPRATVMRKLKWLVKKEVLKKNKNLEYVMTNHGRLNKKIKQNFKDNQIFVAEFLTDFFDYYKNTRF